MKKSIQLTALSLISATVFSQSAHQTSTEFDETPNSERNLPYSTNLTSRAGGDIIWEDDFETPANWEYNGPAAATPPNNGWSIGTETIGNVFGGEDMGTSGNFARFYNGGSASPVNDGPMTFENTVNIDLTGICAPFIEFEQYGARYYVRQAIEISLDAGNSWTEVGNNADMPPRGAENPDAQYAKPMTRRFPVGQLLDTASVKNQVRVRFIWDGGTRPGVGDNFLDYGWFVDNVRIVEGYSYDLEVRNIFHKSGIDGPFAEGLTYYKIPAGQVMDIQLGLTAVNQGCASHTKSKGTFEVFRDGASVFNEASSEIDIVPFSRDSLLATTLFKPSDVGTYNINYIVSGENQEEYTINDTSKVSIEVTDYNYSRSNGDLTGYFIGWAGESVNAGAGIGNVMEIFADGIIGGLEVYIGEPSEEGGEIYASIYRYDGGSSYDFVEISDVIKLTADDYNSYVTIALDENVEVKKGDVILALVGYSGAPTVPIGLAQTSTLGTIVGTKAAGEQTASLNTRVVMMDVIMRGLASLNSLESLDFTLEQNNPNPFSDITRIKYELELASKVGFEIVDLAGKSVWSKSYGLMSSGNHEITLDANELENGTYFYTLLVNDQKVTKKMTVQH